jgi:nitroimidazol reductase NimA-like FMN-containing flavoprotein (pyridoxamine 5'-phosphate oxidase superfamily)
VSKLDLSLSPGEIEAYLTDQRTIRIASAGPDGIPHVVPLWFVWHDGRVFLNSTLGNVTVENLAANPNAAGVVDDGDTYETLRGVLIHGTVERAAFDEPDVQIADRLWSDKYMGGNPTPYGRWKNRVWLRLTPTRMASWDFRGIPTARARAKSERETGAREPSRG